MGRRVALWAGLALMPLTAPAQEAGVPDYLIEGAALLRAASHMAARCADVQVDVDADLDLRVGVYALLERDGWSIDDARLHSDAMRDAVLDQTAALYTDLGLVQPLVSDEVCPVARNEAERGTVLGRLFRIDQP